MRCGRSMAVLLLGVAACSGSGDHAPAEKIHSIGRPDFKVFMTRDTPRATAATVERAIRRSHLVGSYSYTSKFEAYRQLRKFFAKQKDLLAGIKPSDLPASFDVRLLDSTRRSSVSRTIRRLPGVQSVEVNPSCASLRRFASRVKMPPKLVHLNHCVAP